MNLDMTKLEPLLGMMVKEIGAASNAALVILGDKLGLFRALASGKAMSSTELARATGTYERYVREWLSAQAASGFIEYDAGTQRFSMTPEQAAVLADNESPVNMIGGFQMLSATYAGEPKLAEAFKSGQGVGWGEHCNCLFCGVERFFRSGYKAHLIGEWLPALDGVVDKLERGARVADVGCGHGASTTLMADTFPHSRFVGIDFHEPSVAHAREHANGRPNIAFQAARAQDFAGSYDFITIFDALHDMGDPVGAATNIRKRLNDDGTLMIVEPSAGDTLAENLNPVGRIFYAASTQICVPASLSQEVGAALGAQAGERKLREVLQTAGFTRVRRAAETPFNMIIEARP
jgi:2-polyprenyl-3-methyl-5-hydroxy-6-metoxy-1,4-benzoquinol methylase